MAVLSSASFTPQDPSPSSPSWFRSRSDNPTILHFPPNFVRQLSVKARRNCSNIGVAQVVAGDVVANPSNGAVAVPLRSDGSLAVHAGERFGRGITTDSITTPLVQTTAYWFKNCQELIDFKARSIM